jgi:hypothetical protein
VLVEPKPLLKTQTVARSMCRVVGAVLELVVVEVVEVALWRRLGASVEEEPLLQLRNRSAFVHPNLMMKKMIMRWMVMRTWKVSVVMVKVKRRMRLMKRRGSWMTLTSGCLLRVPN